MGVAVSFEKLDQMAVGIALSDALEKQRRGEPYRSPFTVAAVYGCPRCGGLAFECVDGSLATCRICVGRGVISLTLEEVLPPPSGYIERRALIRRHLERLKELTP